MAAIFPMRVDTQPPTMAAVRRVLADSPKTTLDDTGLSPAGVMLLLYPKDDGYVVLLNKRSDTVDHHRSEVSFPGGRRDESDASLLHSGYGAAGDPRRARRPPGRRGSPREAGRGRHRHEIRD